MYNYTNTALALLVRMKLLTPDAAEHLSTELASAIHNARFKDSFVVVDETLKALEEKEKKVLVEPWMAYIRNLESEIESLRTQVEKLLSNKKDLQSKK